MHQSHSANHAQVWPWPHRGSVRHQYVSQPYVASCLNLDILIVLPIANHLGTPGLGTTCASGWALDGFCDSLAYEVAPFNIKISIVQPNMEVNVLTNKITAAPSMEQYSPEQNPAPLCRGIIGGLLDRIQGLNPGSEKPGRLKSGRIEILYPKLPPEMKAALLAETVNAILAIGGHENPPARHIVGFEGVASVKEKLKTVSEELEDFVGVSCAVDIEPNDHRMDSLDSVDGRASGTNEQLVS